MAVLKIRDSSNSSWIDVGGIGTVYQSDTAPASPEPGLMWLDTSSEGAGTTNIIPGYVGRSTFVYKDADETTVGPGVYHHNGTSEQMVYWDADLDVTVTGTSGWNYLYIDDSAVVTAGTDELTATELLYATDAPTWSDTKHGWYNGSDRCIFAVWCTAASTQYAWDHDGGRLIIWDSFYSARALADLDSTWVDVTLSVPSFCSFAEVSVLGYVYDQSGVGLYVRENGSSDNGQLIGWGTRVAGDTCSLNSTIPIGLDASGIFEVKYTKGGLDTCGCYQYGFYLPNGM